MNLQDMDCFSLIKQIEELKKENEKLKKENEKLMEGLKKNSVDFNIKAKEAIQRKKKEKIKVYKKKIAEILREKQDIKTKELISMLEINNKTFYNLKLNVFFNDGAGI
ncbi:hypothetical protein [Clostridium pasteurianum]|uniref:Uncharacterized protein n=1 Tax=Clostridium pasteurianum BC1 TaxID=86416 RepID=R4KB47_CLOPA|nr:hypothetical protein [Clostridium pasteurianum]AGK96855.1 hypothetical protein Clopa_1961 [Clostridium pasteurianum BC1]